MKRWQQALHGAIISVLLYLVLNVALWVALGWRFDMTSPWTSIDHSRWPWIRDVVTALIAGFSFVIGSRVSRWIISADAHDDPGGVPH